MLKFRFSQACLVAILFTASQLFSQVNETIYQWSGAITPTSAKVNAKLTTATSQARLAVSTNSGITSPIYGQYTTVNASNNYMAAMSISGLVAGTQYYYAVESGGILDNSPEDVGTFRTPMNGAQSFKFTVGSCNLNSNHPVFAKMGEKNPLFFLGTGDFHYANPNSAVDINIHRQPYESNMLSQPASRNFFLNYPLAYVWDDHDYCGNDSDSLAAGRANARLAYQEYVPYYPLAAGTGDIPIYQAFTIGRVRFILSDLRSVRGIGNSASLDPTLSMMGTVQKQWFKNECLYAKSNDLIIAWITSVSFGGTRSDNWDGFKAERTELSDFLDNNNIQNLFILSGDAHMTAIDNGSNHDFSTNGNPNDYPVFSASAMNQVGGYKGGTYSEIGPVPPNAPGNSYINPNITYGQYGTVEVTDAGGSQITITFSGYRVDGSGNETLLVSYSFTRTLNTVVPLTFSSFNVTTVQNGRKAKLNWTAQDLGDCGEFMIEKSNTGVHFKSINSFSCSGLSVSHKDYSYEDANLLPGWNYYRIKAVETNGIIHYSAIKRIFTGTKPDVSILSNPVRNYMTVKVNSVPKQTRARYSILNVDSKSLLRGFVRLPEGTSTHTIHVQHLKPGTYLLRLELDGEIIQRKFVIRPLSP